MGTHKVRFDGLSTGKEPHRTWIAANVTMISPSGKQTAHHGADGPRLNNYENRNDPVGSPLVHETGIRDIYVSLLAYDNATGTASFNAWDFPLVAWIWYSIPLLVLGIGIALWPQRKAKVVATAPGQEAPAAPPAPQVAP